MLSGNSLIPLRDIDSWRCFLGASQILGNGFETRRRSAEAAQSVQMDPHRNILGTSGSIIQFVAFNPKLLHLHSQCQGSSLEGVTVEIHCRFCSLGQIWRSDKELTQTRRYLELRSATKWLTGSRAESAGFGSP